MCVYINILKHYRNRMNDNVSNIFIHSNETRRIYEEGPGLWPGGTGGAFILILSMSLRGDVHCIFIC